MEQDELSVEEGEISNDSDNTYTPLERPANYSTVMPNPRFPVNIPQYDSEEEIQSSESDSDSDSQLKKNKKPKIKLKPKARQPQNTKRKKYDIWNTRQEDVLAETLNSCDVTAKDRSRNVETYDFNLARQYYNNQEDNMLGKIFSDKDHKQGRKRTRDNRNNVNYKQSRRSSSRDKVKGKKRIILNLCVDLNNSAEEIAKDIGNKLFEEKEGLILKVVNILGKERALEIFKETKRIEEDGGMLIMNQTRRRTPGGVFLFLVRHDYHITQEQKNEIFEDERQKYKQALKAKQRGKSARMKKEIAASKTKLLPDLLTRAELLASQNPARKIKDSDESDFVNPPPTPETDAHENSNDGMDSVQPALIGNDTLENVRGKLNAYDEDYLDIGCSADMDLF